MPRYKVWIASSDGSIHIPIMDGDDRSGAADLVYALVLVSGSASFDVGVSITGDASSPAGAGSGQTATGQTATSETGGSHVATRTARPASR